MSPIVITFKLKKKMFWFGLVYVILRKFNHKNKYQMPIIEKLKDTTQQNVKANTSNETAKFTILDLKYAYSQLTLDTETLVDDLKKIT